MSKSVEELFRNAPEDATHYAKYCHYKVIGDTWMVYISDNEWVKSDSMYNGQIKPSDIIARPQPKPWSGPEDGLPPVGIECEVENPLEDGQWCKVKILAWDAECAVFQAGADYPYVYDGQGLEGFRPLRTPEQLRENAIREFMDVVGIDCRVTASRAVDAGFKRGVKTQDKDSAINDLASEISGYFNQEDTETKHEKLAKYLFDQGFKREVK